MTKGLWKIAVEYKEGTFYAYQFGEEGYYNGSPENDMILAYFDKAEIPDKFRFSFHFMRKRYRNEKSWHIYNTYPDAGIQHICNGLRYG